MEIMEKLKEHDGQLETIAATVMNHSDILADHTNTLKDHTNRLDRIEHAVIDHAEHLNRLDDKLDSLATKDDISDVLIVLDEVVVLSRKKDQELAMLSHGLRRVTDDVERIKPLVGLK